MKMNKDLNLKKSSVYQIVKIILQIVFFITLPGLYINAFMGIKEVYVGIINQTFQISTSLPVLVEAVSIIPITLLMGRFFCGWMCAFGSYGDFLYFISQKVFHIKFRIPEKADRVLKYVKYVVLVFLTVGVWTLKSTVFDSVKPGDVFGFLANIKGISSIPYVLTEMLIGFVILLFITTGSLFVERFYCRYICPLGAVFALISPLRIFKIKKTRESCSSCNLCTNVCKMGIPMYQYDKISSGECIQCYKCITVCPRKNTGLEVGASKFSALAAGMLAVASITLLYLGSSEIVDDTATEIATIITSESTTSDAGDTSEPTKENSDSMQDPTLDIKTTGYTDGIYEGLGIGHGGGNIILNVTITNGQIDDIEVVSYGDDAPYFEKACNSMVSQIIGRQTSEVEVVSGATYSSNGIKEAVADALSKAK